MSRPYDLKPEMSSEEVEEFVLGHLKDYDLVIINFANPDMVGHTGVVEAAEDRGDANRFGGSGDYRRDVKVGRKTSHHGRSWELRVHA
jgi:2,3-bisphosphoglycerate-independent phosphoglycerate mutase